MKVIKSFKFAANLDYVHSILKQQDLDHAIDTSNLNLHAEEGLESKILKIIEGLDLDENEVNVDEEILRGYKEWDKNMYNVGHYTGGKVPSFTNDKNNYFMYGLLFVVSGLVCFIEILNKENFSRTTFWISFSIILIICGSVFYQYYVFKRKKEQKSKRDS